MATSYTVKSGDTLSQIAQNYGIGVSDISGYKSGNPNLIYPGEKLTLSNIGGSVSASEIKPSQNISVPTQETQQATGTRSLFSSDSASTLADKYRTQLESILGNKKSELETKISDLTKKNADTLSNMETLSTPFRADLEATQRESLYINKNYEENQKLIDELDSLLTEGNNLIKQESSITGLAAIRNPRIQKTMEDVASRVGVIEAVINARNGQIAVAENLIDRSVNAIAEDRKDQYNFYAQVLELDNNKLISLEKDYKDIASSEMKILEDKMNNAQDTADMIKKLMIDPSSAALIGEAGVTLGDSVEEINTKMQNAIYNREIVDFSNSMSLEGATLVINPNSVPSSELITYTDGFGNKHYYTKGQSTGEGVVTFEQFLDAAQRTAQKTFTPTGIEELRKQYNEYTAGYSSQDSASVAEYAQAIAYGFLTESAVKSAVSEAQYSQIINQVAKLNAKGM